MMKNLVIFGTGEFAEIAHYYFTHDSDHRVIAHTVDGAYLEEPTFIGLPVVPFEEIASICPPSDCSMFVAMGIQQVNRQRAAKVGEATAKGYRLTSFLSSKADVAKDLIVKPNCMIMERALLQPQVSLGHNTIIWSTTRLGFRTRIGSHCWITCSLLGEAVDVGDFTFIGLNATIAPSLSIGQSNIIGAGALIVKDTDDNQVYQGVASKVSNVPSDRLRHL